MKHLLLLFIFGSTCLQAQTYRMHIHMKSGVTATIPLRDVSKVTFTGLTEVRDDRVLGVVRDLSLLQNFPNPFNPTTTIEYQLPVAGTVQIRMFNLAGQLVRVLDEGYRSAGTHSMVWDGSDEAGRTLASGVYVYQIAFGNDRIAKKLVFLK
ncbi:hypothetical protein BAC2_03221 [uncultured bacterium]|nr:hypothetical protein BAC2_03221 [uncultured bacterium]